MHRKVDCSLSFLDGNVIWILSVGNRTQVGVKKINDHRSKKRLDYVTLRTMFLKSEKKILLSCLNDNKKQYLNKCCLKYSTRKSDISFLMHRKGFLVMCILLKSRGLVLDSFSFRSIFTCSLLSVSSWFLSEASREIAIFVFVYSILCFSDSLWSYVSHGAQCRMTTCHSTCCGYLIREYHIRFRLFALSNPSVPTLWKTHKRGGGRNSAGFSSDGQVIWVARLSSNSKNKENPLFNKQQRNRFYWNTFETINYKQTMFAFRAKKRRKNIERGRGTMRCG